VNKWLVLIVVFAATRLCALQLQAHGSDVNLYARYAAEMQAASRRGESFYDLHRRRVQEEMRQATPGQAKALDEYQRVEYPPLAVTVMTLPAWLIDAPFDQEFPVGRQPRYAWAYTWMMAACDCAILIIVVLLVRRLFPKETALEQLERCLVYVLCSWPLYAVLYARLDLGVAVLVTAGLAVLVCTGQWWLGLALLAVAIHFKLMPVALAPVWIVAALRETANRVLRETGSRIAVLAGFGVAILVPYFVWEGPAVLEFLQYHKDRGIEIESTWATLQLALPWTVYHSHGSVNVHSAWEPVVTGLAAPVLAMLVAVATGFFIRAVWRRCGEAGPSDLTIGQRWPRLVAKFTLLLLLISIVANKVFSPQYLLWVLPLVPLVDFRPVGRRLFFAATFLMCFLTMRIFPDCFVGEIVWVIGHDGDMPIFDGPTPFGAMLLVLRNLLCVGLAVGVAWSGDHTLQVVAGRETVPQHQHWPQRVAGRLCYPDN